MTLEHPGECNSVRKHVFATRKFLLYLNYCRATFRTTVWLYNSIDTPIYGNSASMVYIYYCLRTYVHVV